jgi:hypothetical protein
MEQLGGFPLFLVFGRAGGRSRYPLKKRLKAVRDRFIRRDRVGRSPLNITPFAVVVFFDDISENEAVSVTRNGADVDRFARVIAENTTDRADSLAESTVGDDDITPDAIENLATMDCLAPTLDEEDQQVEVAGDER